MHENGATICHVTQGRLRIKIPSVKSRRQTAHALEKWLRLQPAITRVEARTLTGSVILIFNPQNVHTSHLVGLVERGLEVCRKRITLQQPPPKHTSPALATNIPKDNVQHSCRNHLWWLIALTGSLICSLIRRLCFNIPLAQGPLSLLGGVALFATIPLVRRALGDFHQRKGVSLFPFLAGTSVLAVALGESLTALEVLWVTHLSVLLEDYVSDKSRRAIRETLEVAAKHAYIHRDGQTLEVALSQIQVGDTVVVTTGGKIPADGTVLTGEALIDESSITGRSAPEVCVPHQRVYQGTVVQQGHITIRAERVGEETYINRMLYLVEESLAHRAPVEKRADLLATRLLYLGALSTIGTFLVTGHFVRTLTVMLVVACPCATVLAASTAVTAALANAARKRCLVKGGLYLEKMGEANCFCFDKTGTVTTDTPQVGTIVTTSPNRDPLSILMLAASAEAHNTHPLARAIVREAAHRGIEPRSASTYQVVLGKGIRATVGEDDIIAGNMQYLEESGIEINSDIRAKVEPIAEKGHTLIFVVNNSELLGVIGVSNTIRREARAVIRWLREDHVDALYLVTGDVEPVAGAISDHLELDDFRASLLPEEKARFVKELQASGREVVMVGDGVNDALALSKARVGIAMGAGGSEAAIEAADIALADSNLESLIMLRQLSHQTVRIIEQNFWLATSTNLIGIFLGAAGWITPLISGLHHIVHTLGVMFNSGRLVRWQTPGLSREGEPYETGD